MIKSKKELIRKLTADGKTEEAIDALHLSDISEETRKEVIQIADSYATLKSNVIQGLMTSEQETTERSRINDHILALIEKSDKKTGVFLRSPKKRRLWEYVIGFGVLVGIFGGIAEFSGWNLRSLFGGGNTDDVFTVTVFVHGKKGKDDRILKNQGQVVLCLRTNEIPCSINEKGEATFKEIPLCFRGKSVPLRIEHQQRYRATKPDSLYLLVPNAAIFLEVALEGTDRIFGKVMDYETEQWLDSVRVSIENIYTLTDSYGWFELSIPEVKQRKFQRVSFFKKGYAIMEFDSIPVHTQQQISVSLKKNEK